MTKEEFKAARLEMGLTAKEMGKFLWGKTARTIYYYEDGTYDVPLPDEEKINRERLKNGGN